MHSSRPDCVFGGARLISSTSTRFANTGPGLNSKRPSRWLYTLEPTTSAGSRSDVHWTLAYAASMDRDSARTSAVLPTPGWSSISTCPSAMRATSTSRSVRSGSLTANATLSAMRVPSAATSAGSSSTLSTTRDGRYYARLPERAATWPPLPGQRLDAQVPALKLGIGVQLLGGQLRRDPAGDHHHVAVGDRCRDAQVLLDEQDADAALRQPVDGLHEL